VVAAGLGAAGRSNLQFTPPLRRACGTGTRRLLLTVMAVAAAAAVAELLEGGSWATV
jgi:hypothetical protein